MRSTALFLLCAGVLWTAVSPAEAGAQTLTGLVVDQSSGASVALARVTLLDMDSVPVTSALTDLSGYFTLTAAEAGSYWVRAEEAFYWTYTGGPVSLAPGDTSSVAFTLGPRPVEIEGLVSFYSFFSEKKKGRIIVRLCDDIVDRFAGVGQ